MPLDGGQWIATGIARFHRQPGPDRERNRGPDRDLRADRECNGERERDLSADWERELEPVLALTSSFGCPTLASVSQRSVAPRTWTTRADQRPSL